MASSKPQNDWGEYRTLILAELKRLSDGIDSVKIKIDEMHASDIGDLKAQMAVLQFKSGVWGFMAGAIPSIAAAAYVVLHK
jgi:hypothetical protein